MRFVIRGRYDLFDLSTDITENELAQCFLLFFFGALPVASDLPVLLCAILAAFPLSIPSRIIASYILWTFVFFGIFGTLQAYTIIVAYGAGFVNN